MHKKGFTLAEVLITLSIIGVVAALTIAPLVKDYEEKTNEIRFKKAYSEIAQAWRMHILENGGSAVGSPALNTNNAFNQYFLEKYFSSSRTAQSHTFTQLYDKDTVATVYGGKTKGGVFIGHITSSSNGLLSSCDSYCAAMRIDVNGERGPNRVGYDVFPFYLLAEGITPINVYRPTDINCVKPDENGNDWGMLSTNGGYACSRRILENKPKWCTSGACN